MPPIRRQFKKEKRNTSQGIPLVSVNIFPTLALPKSGSGSKQYSFLSAGSSPAPHYDENNRESSKKNFPPDIIINVFLQFNCHFSVRASSQIFSTGDRRETGGGRQGTVWRQGTVLCLLFVKRRQRTVPCLQTVPLPNRPLSPDLFSRFFFRITVPDPRTRLPAG